VRPVIFGEVLFSVSLGGKETMGGSPFLTAWNLAGLGLNPLFITRIGMDERGKTILAAMTKFGMDTSGVQRDKFLPTGVLASDSVEKKQKLGIPEAQAFDAIDKEEALEAAQRAGGAAILYHGTLTARSRVSLTALEHLKRSLNCPVYVDVNIRAPWVTTDTALDMVKGANCVQLCRQDFEQMIISCSFVGLDFLGMAGYLRDVSSADSLIVTLGKSGAILSTKLASIEIKQKLRPTVVDAEGCGEAFAAVVIAGMVKGWPMTQSVTRANEFAAAICQMKGEFTQEKEFYTSMAKKLEIPQPA